MVLKYRGTFYEEPSGTVFEGGWSLRGNGLKSVACPLVLTIKRGRKCLSKAVITTRDGSYEPTTDVKLTLGIRSPSAVVAAQEQETATNS